MAKPSNELIVVEKIAAGEVFTSSDKVEALLKSVEDQVLAVPADVATEKGRAAIASLAHKVARSKTALEEMGKEFAGVVAESRRTIKDRLDALKVKVRQPLTDWETADGKRRAVHEAALAEIAENGAVSMPAPSRVIQARIDWLAEFPARDWEEFAARATSLIAETSGALKFYLEAALTNEAEKAELDRLRQEAAARAEQERQAEAARREVEAASAREIDAEKARIQKEEEVRRAIRTITSTGPVDVVESGAVETEESDLIPPTSPDDADLAAEVKSVSETASTFAAEAVQAIGNLILASGTAPIPEIASMIVATIEAGGIPNIRTTY